MSNVSRAHMLAATEESAQHYYITYISKLSNKMTTRIFFPIKCTRGNYPKFLLLTAAHHNQQIATVLQSVIWHPQSAECWQLLQYAGTNRMMQITSTLLHTSVSSVVILQWQRRQDKLNQESQVFLKTWFICWILKGLLRYCEQKLVSESPPTTTTKHRLMEPLVHREAHPSRAFTFQAIRGSRGCEDIS